MDRAVGDDGVLLGTALGFGLGLLYASLFEYAFHRWILHEPLARGASSTPTACMSSSTTACSARGLGTRSGTRVTRR
jgi:hypothetical protein